MIDAGLPGYRGRLEAELAAMGRSLGDIDAILLTHSHPDHLGLAAGVRKASGGRVLAHAADGASVRGEAKEGPPAFFKQGWRPFIYRYLLHAVRNGAARTLPVANALDFSDGEVIDVPGRPRVIHAPGHTPGSSALLLHGGRVLFSGDVLVTVDLLTGRPGPALAPGFVNADSGAALRSLGHLSHVGAELLLPGHGEPWRGGVEAAVRLAAAKAGAGQVAA